MEVEDESLVAEAPDAAVAPEEEEEESETLLVVLAVVFEVPAALVPLAAMADALAEWMEARMEDWAEPTRVVLETAVALTTGLVTMPVALLRTEDRAEAAVEPPVITGLR